MAIRTDEDLENVFKEAIEDVITNVSDRAQKLLIQHINKDTYGISKTAEFSMGKINQNYLDGTGTPSYEFRDQAWDIKFQDELRGFLFSIFYNGDNLSAPSSSSPYLHGNFNEGKDRRANLAEILNVSGVASDGDFNTTKIRSPFWDNFIEELRQKIGGWLYTEFNNMGIKIPALKLYKGSFTE